MTHEEQAEMDRLRALLRSEAACHETERVISENRLAELVRVTAERDAARAALKQRPSLDTLYLLGGSLEVPRIEEAIDAFIADLPPEEEEWAWQPIKTAPFGVPVLLFFRSHGYSYLACGKKDRTRGWAGASFYSDPPGAWTTVMGETPTLWMPMPWPGEPQPKELTTCPACGHKPHLASSCEWRKFSIDGCACPVGPAPPKEPSNG